MSSLSRFYCNRTAPCRSLVPAREPLPCFPSGACCAWHSSAPRYRHHLLAVRIADRALWKGRRLSIHRKQRLLNVPAAFANEVEERHVIPPSTDDAQRGMLGVRRSNQQHRFANRIERRRYRLVELLCIRTSLKLSPPSSFGASRLYCRAPLRRAGRSWFARSQGEARQSSAHDGTASSISQFELHSIVVARSFGRRGFGGGSLFFGRRLLRRHDRSRLRAPAARPRR